jgi:hypothetical protein
MRLSLRFGVGLSIIFLAALFFFPVYFNGPYPHPPGPAFEKGVSKLYLHTIETQQPALVFLGDSILTKSIDETAFQEQTGLSTYKLDVPGSSSALWYLIIKTNIAPAQPAPRYLIVLFRDTMLTVPAFRVNWPYFGLIDKFAGPNDTLLAERAYLSQLTSFQIALEKYFPLYTYRAELRESLDSGVRRSLPGLFGCERGCADDAMLVTLSDIAPDEFAKSIVQAEQILYTPDRLEFAPQAERSFLPEMIRLARQRGIQIIFVRAPTRIFPDDEAEPAKLKSYMGELESYLAESNVPLLDLAWVDGIEDRHFSDPHHMTIEGKGFFTTILAAALEPHLK